MAQSVQSPEPFRAMTSTEPTVGRLRTVTGNTLPRKCACGACNEWNPPRPRNSR